MSKPRVGIVVPKAGVGSEVWIGRQYRAFSLIEPVLLYADAVDNFSPDIEAHRFAQPFFRPSALRRLQRRLGSPAAEQPNAAQRADIRAVIGRAKLDGLFCHFAWTGVMVSAAIDSLPVFWQVHGRDVSAKLREPAFRKAVAAQLPHVAHLFAVGRFQIGRLEPLGLTERHSVVPCGAPTEQFARNPLPERKAGEPIRYIAVGRLSEEKGVAQTLEAFQSVARRRADVRLCLVGEGPLDGELRRRISAGPCPEYIELAGPLPPDEVARHLAGAHVFLQHSLEIGGWVEGFGVSLTEAGAAGLPLVASRTGGIPDQVEHGVNGLLFTPGDVEGQAAHMLVLADDELLRRSMGAGAREVAKRFDAALMAQKIEAEILKTLR